MRVAVTGGAGFIGTNLGRVLTARGVDLVCIDDFSTGSRADAEAAGYGEIVEADVLHGEALRSASRGADALVHLAAQAGVPSSIADPVHDAELNVFGTLNALLAARDNGIERFVFASSNAPLGTNGYPGREDVAPRPLSPYGASKTAGEAYCSAFSGSYGIKATALRFANVYGPYSYHKGSVIAHYMKSALQGEPLQVNGDGTQTRDFVYVTDLVSGIDRLLHAADPGPLYQLGSGEETSILEVVDLFGELFDGIAHRFAPPLPGEIARSRSDVSLARAELGFDPSTPLRVGLAATRDWFVSSS